MMLQTSTLPNVEMIQGMSVSSSAEPRVSQWEASGYMTLHRRAKPIVWNLHQD